MVITPCTFTQNENEKFNLVTKQIWMGSVEWGDGLPEWALSWNKDIKHSTFDSIDGSEIARKTIDVSADDDDSSNDTGFAEKQYICGLFQRG